MQKWLLEISFGPVQSFIEAARKSRDLFAGSFILSEVVRAAAKQLIADGCQLIYPVSERVNKNNKDDISNLSNILLVQCNDMEESAVRKIADNAITKGKEYLIFLANQAREDYRNHGVILRSVIFDYQIADALEAYAAWAELSADYKQSYDNLKQSIAARKNTRDFAPMYPVGQVKDQGVPKSSFDGLRESVLPSKSEINRRAMLRFDLKQGEQLDALGSVKRWVALREEQNFIPLARVAAQSWLLTLEKRTLNELEHAYEKLVERGLASKIKGLDIFPFDGVLLFTETLAAELATAIKDGDESQKVLAQLQTILYKIAQSGKGYPCPYIAMIMADGDRMGAFIDKASSQLEHHKISRAVADFAEQATKIARAYNGQAIYAGGEDLLIIAPLASVIGLSQKLSEEFANKIKPVAQVLGVSDAPTLRVGAALCHIFEPYSLIRKYAKAAERFAKGKAGTKQQGNALGLVLHIRSGHILEKWLSFSNAAEFENLKRWIELYANKKISGGLAYRIREAAGRLQKLQLSGAAIEAELKLLLDRARSSTGAGRMDKQVKSDLLKRYFQLADIKGHTADSLRLLAEELILARWLSARTAGEVK